MLICLICMICRMKTVKRWRYNFAHVEIAHDILKTNHLVDTVFYDWCIDMCKILLKLPWPNFCLQDMITRFHLTRNKCHSQKALNWESCCKVWCRWRLTKSLWLKTSQRLAGYPLNKVCWYDGGNLQMLCICSVVLASPLVYFLIITIIECSNVCGFSSQLSLALPLASTYYLGKKHCPLLNRDLLYKK